MIGNVCSIKREESVNLKYVLIIKVHDDKFKIMNIKSSKYTHNYEVKLQDYNLFENLTVDAKKIKSISKDKIVDVVFNVCIKEVKSIMEVHYEYLRYKDLDEEIDILKRKIKRLKKNNEPYSQFEGKLNKLQELRKDKNYHPKKRENLNEEMTSYRSKAPLKRNKIVPTGFIKVYRG